MNRKDLIHVKLEYEERLQSRRRILSLEMNLLNIIKAMKKYYSLRLTELKLKTELEKMIRSLSSKMRILQTILPKSISVAAPTISRKREEIEETIKDESLEFQLREIQEKLKSLGT